MRVYYPWLAAILGLEIISALTIFHPQAHTVALLAVTAVMLILAWKKPAFAASLLLIEYIIGSKGALLRAGGDGVGHGGVPLRIAWFTAFFLGWLLWAFQNKTYREWKGYLKGRAVYLVLGFVLVYAFMRGKVLGNSFVLADANAWGVWLLLLPVLDLVHHKADELRHYIPRALMVAFGWLIVKTLALFYIFSHFTNPAWLEAIYLWVRRTGVGEITRALADTNAWRVFFQSHVYALPVAIGGAWYAITHPRFSSFGWMIWIGAWATLTVSLSRSLLIGTGTGMVASFILILISVTLPMIIGRAQLQSEDSGLGTPLREGERQERARVFIGGWLRWAGAIFAALLVVVGLFYAPPRPVGSLTDLFASRTNLNEDAAVSRWKLLPVLWEGVKRHPVLGSGFGATVTYQSKDPRVVAITGGTYTTYAFEWGWLDHWFKFGILGIPLILWMLLRVGKRAWQSQQAFWIRGALVSSLVALAVTHFFTPYINHPLGIMWLIVLEGFNDLSPYDHD